LKILFVADVSIADVSSGSEVVLYNQVIKMDQSGFNVSVITRRSNCNQAKIGTANRITSLSYYADPSKFLLFANYVLKKPVKLFDKIKNANPFQVIISHQPFTIIPLIIRRRIKKTPIIYVFHSPSHEEYILSKKSDSKINNYFSSYLRFFAEKFAIKNANKVIVLSHYMKEKLIQTHNISKKYIQVNPGGVDLERFRPPERRSLEKKRIGLPNDHIHLLTVRNLEYRMGIDNLIRSVDILKKKNLKVHLTIGGEGPERKAIEKLISNLKLFGNITLTGFIPNEKLPKYYGSADLFILPTRKLEGFGLVTIESMACGTPVLGTPVGGTKEILSNFDSNFLFEDLTPEAIAKGIITTIHKYYAHQEKYEDLRHRCRKYAQRNYSWKRHIDNLKLEIERHTLLK
jgi:glycosyltransferase involved in cell wall biosynthesis